MKVRKFCACGVKLERDVSDEDTARRAVEMFRTAHAGGNHLPITRKQYDELIRRIIKKNWNKGIYPISEMSELEAFQIKEIDDAIDWLEKSLAEHSAIDGRREA